MQSTSIPQLIRHFLIAIAGSAIVVGFLFYAVSEPGHNIRPQDVIDAIKNASLFWFLVYFASMLLGIALRALRYQILLRAAGEPAAQVPDFKTMWLITAVRSMVVDFLPARLGELIYVALLKKVTKTSIPSGLSSLLFATLLDIAVLAPIMLIIGVLIKLPQSDPMKIAMVTLAVVVAFFIGMKFILPIIMRWLNRLADVDNRIIQFLLRIANQLYTAINATLQAGVFFKTLVLTFFIRLLKYGGLLILFYSVVGGSFADLVDFSSIKVLGAMIASEMTAALPIPTLMSFGAWELGGMTFMSLFGASPQASLITLLSIHIKTQALDYGVGLSALCILLLVRPRDRAQQQPSSRKNLMYPIGFASLAVGLMAVAWSTLQSTSAVAITAIKETPEIATSDRPEWFQQLNGKVVWRSNRLGNHDILMMSLPDQTITRLTTSDYTDNHPRISPDGKSVVFIRSQKPWISWRELQPWDVWMVDIETGKERRLVEFGTSPTWSADGNSVYFQRTPGQIWRYDLRLQKAEQLHTRSEQGLPDTELHWPSINPQGRLALTYRDHGRPTNILKNDDGTITVVERGCQITWSPQGDFAFFVGKGGHQGNVLKRYDPNTGTVQPWLDGEGEFSKEYFPRLDASQQYLIYAASRNDHPHDTADYEIFLWNTKTPSNETQRLTFHGNNDAWPDIWLAPK